MRGLLIDLFAVGEFSHGAAESGYILVVRCIRENFAGHEERLVVNYFGGGDVQVLLRHCS